MQRFDIIQHFRGRLYVRWVNSCSKGTKEKNVLLSMMSSTLLTDELMLLRTDLVADVIIILLSISMPTQPNYN